MTTTTDTLLLVDDNEMNRDLLSRRLQRNGHDVVTAVDGPHALELIEARGPAGQRVLGNCYGHIALAVPDLGSLCERLKQAGVTFIADPDGFEIELTERA
jgi:CheY-like chemotaxis protein